MLVYYYYHMLQLAASTAREASLGSQQFLTYHRKSKSE